MNKQKKYRYNPKLAKAQKEYLLMLKKDNDDRRNAIEKKLLHISSSSGIVVSLVGLMITLFYNKLLVLCCIPKLVIAFVFCLTAIALFVSIFYARKTLNIKKYTYVKGNVSTIKKNHRTENELLKEEIEDLIYSVPSNTSILNNKGTDLIQAHRAFNIGLYGIGFLIISLTILSFTPSIEEKEESKNEIEAKVEVQVINQDSSKLLDVIEK